MTTKQDTDAEPRKRITHYEYSDDASWSFDFCVRPDEFNQFINSTTEIVDEAQLQITTDGLKVLAVDPANCALVEDTRTSVTELGGVTTVGVNLTRLKRDLPAYAGGDYYVVEVLAENDELRVRSPHGECTTPMFDPDSARQMPEIPDVDHEQEFTIPAYRWKGAVGSVARAAGDKHSSFSGTVQLIPSDGKLIVDGTPERSDRGPYSWELPEAKTREGGAPLLSPDYLASITAGLPDTGDLTVRFGDEQPLEIEADGLRYVQASRVSMGDDDE